MSYCKRLQFLTVALAAGYLFPLCKYPGVPVKPVTSEADFLAIAICGGVALIYLSLTLLFFQRVLCYAKKVKHA